MPSARALSAETKYALLLQISRSLSGTFDLDVILDRILDTIRSVLDYDAAGIFVLATEDPHGRYASQGLQRIAGVSARGFDQRPADRDPMLTSGKGIVGHVIATGESYLTDDVRSDPYYVDGRRATRSEIAVPVVIGSRAIGALNLESDLEGAYVATDIETLVFFAEAAAISIEKAMLHRHLLEKRRIEGQLALAHDVQSRLLPRKPPTPRGYDVAAVSLPCFEIGGDYFDYVELDDNRLAVVIADVAGKGIAAALIMATFRAIIRTHASREGPADVMQSANRLLEEAVGPPAFVTAVYGVLDCGTGRFTYANCGHNPPILLRAGGETAELRGGGPFLGVFENARYEAAETTLSSGDVLLMYTDGVVEPSTTVDVQFGERRLAQVARAAVDSGAAGVIDAVVRATREHTGSEAYEDDFTLVVIQRR